LRIKLSKVTLNIEEYSYDSSEKDYIFFLHGFSGSAKDWNKIIPALNHDFHFISIDIIGHGQSDSPGDLSFYTSEAVVEQINELILYFTNKPVIIAGYSMGGRAALTFALKYPQMLKGLILESASAGIIEEDLRKERAEADEKLAEFIKTHSMEEFVNYWMNFSLFISQMNLPDEKLEEIRRIKINNSKAGLSNSLRGFGTGKMPAILPKDIESITAKTLLISGELDLKYTGINTVLVKIFPDASHVIIKNAGHNIHLEQPSSFINVINDFLDKF
jgi:2-succinyl-6-hydroxy-2,4-cyclohexadiene-1-carboxylate synthase